MGEITNLEAVRDAIASEMRINPRIVLLGEGTGERGGCFGQTKGLFKEFGSVRLVDTPISELGFTGLGIGAAATGLHPIVDLMFADFINDAMTQLVNQAAKMHYMSNGKLSVPLVIRAAMGTSKGGGAHHSGCLYPIFMHVPGLKVVTPASPTDGYGLMLTALRENNPVVFLDHKALFPMKGEAPVPNTAVPFGRARVWQKGKDLTVIAVSLMVHRVLSALSLIPEISVEVIDPRTLVPLDLETIFESVDKTGRLLIVDESYPICSFASEVAAAVADEMLYSLDAPIRRLNTVPVAHPVSPPLEKATTPQPDRIAKAISALMKE